jgi:hypothetical protein
MEALIVISLTLCSVFLVMTFATHMTLFGDFKYYKPIYESFERGDYEYSPLGDFLYFKKGYNEIVFFPDGAIQLTNGVYIHLSFISWLSPYSLYYRRKFNKVRDRIIAQHALDNLYERELDRWRDSPFADYGPIGDGTPVVKDIKPFKLLRG